MSIELDPAVSRHGGTLNSKLESLLSWNEKDERRQGLINQKGTP